MTILAALLGGAAFAAPPDAVTLPLNDEGAVTPHNVTVTRVRFGGGDALEVRQAGPVKGFDPDTFAYVPGLDFHDGTIEVDGAEGLWAGNGRTVISAIC